MSAQPVEQLGLDDPIWLDVHQAAAIAQMHWRTISDACRDKSLHGGQRKKAGHWRIHRNCLDAWLAGEQCPHQLNSS